MLKGLLVSLAAQDTRGLFDFEIVVVDNDSGASAQPIVAEFCDRHPEVKVVFDVEAVRGIPHARNRTVRLARGNMLAFIDDDEFADPTWLAELYESLVRFSADATLGPVVPEFPSGSREWATQSRTFERPRFATGTVVESKHGRTGNALVRADWARRRRPSTFDIQFSGSGGEDFDFFVWVVACGGLLVWCDSAVVHETVPLDRQTLGSLLDRGFRGSLVYWRLVNAQRPIWRQCAEASLGGLAGAFLLLLGLLGLPKGLGWSSRVWMKAAKAFGRVAALRLR